MAPTSIPPNDRKASPRASGRRGQIARLSEGVFDALVLGGGVSGVAVAHVLTARGYRVALADNRDFASGVSQESSQLIWGGIKYLENGHVGVVNELCRERNELVRDYPTRVAPMRFLYPRLDHDAHGLAALTLGAWLYHAIGRGYDAPPRRLTRDGIAALVPALKPEGFRGGFEYSDARMIDSDARLTLDLLFDAMDAGLTACNYLELTDIGDGDATGARRLTFADAAPALVGDKNKVEVRARWVVNACGVWADEVNARFGLNPPHRHVFSKGIHITIPPVETGGRALTLLDRERRPFFVIPWGAATLVGTTDTAFDGPPRRVYAEPDEINFLRRELESRFRLTVTDEMILGTKAGLRPLVAPARRGMSKTGGREDFLALARGHKIWSDPRAAFTAAWGGKYTSCFAMAREIADTIRVRPSGEPRRVAATFPAARLTDDVLAGEASAAGENASDADAARALAHACRLEMVVALEDILRRRTNLSLKVANNGRGAHHEHDAALQRIEEAIRDSDAD